MPNYACRLHGSVTTVGETWMQTFTLVTPLTTVAAVLDEVEASLPSLWSGAYLATVDPWHVWQEISAAVINDLTPAPGVNPFGPFARRPLGLSRAGSGVALPLPPQASVRVTFEADLQRPSLRPVLGGWYAPPVAAATAHIAAPGWLTTATQTTIADAHWAWVQALQDIDQHVAVWSRTLGLVGEVVALRVGQRLDVQRRRAAQQTDAYIRRPIG